MSDLGYADLLGTPFKYGGRSKEAGFDCYGLAKEVYRRLGVNLPEFESVVAPAEIDERMAAGKQQFVKIDQPEPYCIVMLSVRPPYVSHVGVVLPNLYQFLHTMRGVKVCVERLDSLEWCHRIRGYYKWPQ